MANTDETTRGFKKVLEQDIDTVIDINFKRPTGKKVEEYPEAKGLLVQVNLEMQSPLVKAICLCDDALIQKYGERAVLDAKNCIEQDGLSVKLCKHLDAVMEGMTGKRGYEAMEIVNRNPEDEASLRQEAFNWAYDSTPVARTRGPQTEEQAAAAILKLAGKLSPEMLELLKQQLDQ